MLDTLLDAIRNGDRAAFDDALAPEREWLLRRARTRIDDSLRRFVDPDDLVQDVLLIAYRKLGETRLDRRVSLRAWLDQVLENRTTDVRRRHFRRTHPSGPTRSLDESQSTSSAGSAPLHAFLTRNETTPSGAAAAREDHSALQEALTQLSPDHRRVIEYLRIQGLTAAEAAERMQRSPEAVYKLCNRALDALRGLLPQPSRESDSHL